MTVRRCSIEAYPAHWVPSVSVWTCDACGNEVTVKGWPDDPPDGWYVSVSDVRDARTGQSTGRRLHCCSFACTDQLDGAWTKPPIGHNPVYSTIRLLRKPIRGFGSAAEFAACVRPRPTLKVNGRTVGTITGWSVGPGRHRPECNEHSCYCADPDDPDPMCDCGEPGWMCRCAELEANDPFHEDEE